MSAAAEPGAVAAVLLTADRGNTTLDLCCWRGGWPVFRERLPAGDLEAIGGVLTRIPGDAGAGGVECVACNVVPGGLDVLAAALAESGIRLRLAGVDLPCPLDLDYDDPSTLGVDRWVGAYAGYQMLLHGAAPGVVAPPGVGGPAPEAADAGYGAEDPVPCAVTVDCGTAVTVNLVDRSGRFLGGAIAPGPMTLIRGLALAAPGLPAGDLTGDAPLPARSTPDAVRAGIQRGFAAAVDGLVASCLAEGPWDDGRRIPVYTTGGDASVLMRWGKRMYQHVPDLVHRGLRALADASGHSGASATPP